MREVTDRQKDRHTDTGDFIICPMLCYSNGTDNKSLSALAHSNTKSSSSVLQKPAFLLLLIKACIFCWSVAFEKPVHELIAYELRDDDCSVDSL